VITIITTAKQTRKQDALNQELENEGNYSDPR
jgi:hypothetical protein